MQETNIQEAQESMTVGRWTALKLCEYYLDRIEKIDRHGPALNAVIEVNPEALATADRLDQERAARGPRGPLHGIPVLLKDNIDTHDRMQTTAGSLALEGSIAPRDAFIVKKLRDAGAVILGKTNLSEWANFRGLHSISGWSSRGGLTRNPYALNRSACGSSSGSAAAVAADLCTVAVGTETDGSIICPAQTNGIVGIKPTLGAVSRSGIIPIAHSQDTAGPMARTVADAAILLAVLVGFDARDPVTRAGKGRTFHDHSTLSDERGLKGSRIGVARGLAGSNPRVTKIFDECIDVLRGLGAAVLDPVEVANADKLDESEIEVLYHEFKADLNRYLESLGPTSRVRSMADVIRFNEANADLVMPFFGQEHMIAAQGKASLRAAKYRAALAANLLLAREEGLDATLDVRRLDAIVVPSGGPAWLIDLVNGDSTDSDILSTSLPAVAGYPHVTVPAGLVLGLPVGLSFIGRAWDEPKLVGMAHAFERATAARRSPLFLDRVPDPPTGRMTPMPLRSSGSNA